MVLGRTGMGGWANMGIGFSFEGVSARLRRVFFSPGELVSWSFYRLTSVHFQGEGKEVKASGFDGSLGSGRAA